MRLIIILLSVLYLGTLPVAEAAEPRAGNSRGYEVDVSAGHFCLQCR